MPESVYQLKLKKGINADLVADQALILAAIQSSVPLTQEAGAKYITWLNRYSHLPWYDVDILANDSMNSQVDIDGKDDYIVFVDEEDEFFSRPTPLALFMPLPDGEYNFYPDNTFPNQYTAEDILKWRDTKPGLFKPIGKNEYINSKQQKIVVGIYSNEVSFKKSFCQKIINDINGISARLGDNDTAYLVALFNHLNQLLAATDNLVQREHIITALKKIHDAFNTDIGGPGTSIVNLLSDSNLDLTSLPEDTQVKLNQSLHGLMRSFSELEDAAKPMGIKVLEVVGGIVGFLIGAIIGAIALHLIVGGPFNPASIFTGLIGLGEGAMIGKAVGVAVMLTLGSTVLLAITTFCGKSTPKSLLAMKDCFFKPAVNEEGKLDAKDLTIYAASRLAVEKGCEMFKRQADQLAKPPSFWDCLPKFGK